MGFQAFGYPEVLHQLGLTLDERDLYGDVPGLELAPESLGEMQDAYDLARAIGTEKARSELIIAPILLSLRRRLDRGFGLFSGGRLNADVTLGLDGVCDFLLTRSPRQVVVTAPILAVVTAKDEQLRSGLGRCIATMVAMREFNEHSQSPLPTAHGIVTDGALWHFLRLDTARITLDRKEYAFANVGKIFGILAHIMQVT